MQRPLHPEPTRGRPSAARFFIAPKGRRQDTEMTDTAPAPAEETPWTVLGEHEFACIDTYYWYDGPILFSFDHEGARRLAVAVDFCGKSGDVTYKVSSPSIEMMGAMTRNEIDLRDVYLVGPFYDLKWSSKLEIRPSAHPMSEEDLPDPGVRLSLDDPAPAAQSSVTQSSP